MLLKVKKEGAEALRSGLVYYYQILEEEMAIHSSILKYPMGRGAWHDAVHGVTKSTHACM